MSCQLAWRSFLFSCWSCQHWQMLLPSCGVRLHDMTFFVSVEQRKEAFPVLELWLKNWIPTMPAFMKLVFSWACKSAANYSLDGGNMLVEVYTRELTSSFQAGLGLWLFWTVALLKIISDISIWMNAHTHMNDHRKEGKVELMRKCYSVIHHLWKILEKSDKSMDSFKKLEGSFELHASDGFCDRNISNNQSYHLDMVLL